MFSVSVACLTWPTSAIRCSQELQPTLPPTYQRALEERQRSAVNSCTITLFLFVFVLLVCSMFETSDLSAGSMTIVKKSNNTAYR